jgi:homoserine kinase
VWCIAINGYETDCLQSGLYARRQIILTRLDRNTTRFSIQQNHCAGCDHQHLVVNRNLKLHLTKTNLNSVTVRAPATTANLGPGFDCIGMALDLWNELTLTRGDFSISATGEGADMVPLDTRNLAVTGVEAVFNYIGEPVPGLRYEQVNRVPFARGMGSSSSAIVSGLVAGSAISGADLTNEEITILAADIEGHPDNVAPAIYGGCTVGVRNGTDKWIVDQVKVPEDLHAVLFVPEMEMNTHESRAVLPDQISRTDAVFNIGRAALLVNALSTGRLELLKYATDDKLHQPHRAQAFTALPQLIEAAIKGGAHGAFLSGAGPSVLALATEREVTISYEMSETARILGVEGNSMILAVAHEGASVMSSS